jgi:hypothetical protein
LSIGVLICDGIVVSPTKSSYYSFIYS